MQRIDYATTLSGKSKAVILTGVLLGLFLSALDQTIVSTALPRMVSDLQGIDLIGWVATAYLLASTAMVPIYGKLSDLYGRKVILIFGVVIFLAGSMLCGIAPSMLLLVAFRAFQGLGAAALTSTAFSIPADLFVPAERAKYQGVFGAVFGLSSVIGPFLGGLLTDSVGWRWVFYVNVPIGLAALGFIVAKMPKLESGITGKIDYPGAVLLVLGVAPLLLALTMDKSRFGWGSPLILGNLAAGTVALAFFFWVETKSPSPIIPLELFRTRTFALIIPISAVIGAAMMGSVMFLSVFLVNVLSVSATTAGTTLIPLTMSIVVSSLISSVIVQKLGNWKVPILVGLFLVGLGLWLLSTMHPDVTLNGVRLRMVVVGIGLGPCMPLLNLGLQNAVPHSVVGAATASRQFFQQLGGAAGVALLGALLTSTLSTAMEKNLANVRDRMPPHATSSFNLSKLRNGSQGQPIPPELEGAVKAAFTEAITQVYRSVIPLIPIAFVLMLFVPHLPLRRSNLGSTEPLGV